jgi:hypothetical protein
MTNLQALVQLNLTQKQVAEVRALVTLGINDALQFGAATCTSFAGLDIDVHRGDQLDPATTTTTSIRCVISRCGTTIESTQWLVNECQVDSNHSGRL